MPADLRYGRLVWVAVTTTFKDPPPSDHVPLPWHPSGRVLTKLTRRSAAVTSWLETAYADEIESFGGDVPSNIMRLIEAQL